MRALLRLAALAALISAPAWASDTGPALLPPYTPAYAPQSLDERGLWQLADEDERALRDSPDVIRDPALNAYLHGVLCRAVGDARCRAVRLYVVHMPAFNAFMTANGTMVVWTGLLLRVRNEAELAAALGHEFGHFELRHSLRGFRHLRTSTDLLAWATILAPRDTGLRQDIVTAHYAFSRSQESEADLLGLRYMQAAGYRASAVPQLWERMMAEEDATALGRKRTVKHHYAAGFFADHPTELARATTLRAAAGPDADRGDDGAERYAAALAPWRATFLVDQIKLNDFGGSEYLLGQLAGERWSADLLFARAELYRERGNPRDLVSAADFYRQAIAAGCTDPAAWRGLGLSLLRAQQEEPGRAALRRYLEQAPDARDRAAMTMLIEGNSP